MPPIPNGSVVTSKLILGDCRKVLPTIPSASVDCIITDPPYACIDREYGWYSEEDWFEMMFEVVPECMRVLKPKGSAVFVLQPNSEVLGRMRTWVWDFMVWVGGKYGIVQDVYWWNYTAMANCQSIQGKLLKPSVKYTIWAGSPDCYRCQDKVLLRQSDMTAANYKGQQVNERMTHPSGHSVNNFTMKRSIDKRNGMTTPTNLLPFSNSESSGCGGAYGHGASTPLPLCKWWVRYICPPSGVVLDPFSGSGTVGLAAKAYGCSYIGIEKEEKYHNVAIRRLFPERKISNPPPSERIY